MAARPAGAQRFQGRGREPEVLGGDGRRRCAGLREAGRDGLERRLGRNGPCATATPDTSFLAFGSALVWEERSRGGTRALPLVSAGAYSAR